MRGFEAGDIILDSLSFGKCVFFYQNDMVYETPEFSGFLSFR